MMITSMAVVMVEMDVSSREDHCTRRMLNLGQLLREIRNVMIVDKLGAPLV